MIEIYKARTKPKYEHYNYISKFVFDTENIYFCSSDLEIASGPSIREENFNELVKDYVLYWKGTDRMELLNIYPEEFI